MEGTHGWGAAAAVTVRGVTIELDMLRPNRPFNKLKRLLALATDI
jgi:hypothetical protein